VHGLAEYGARYDGTARKLSGRGYLVFAHDQRGHGRTAGSPEKCGNLAERDGWNRAVKDISLLLETERMENPGLPVILLGHSMGSFMAQQMMYQHPRLLDGCVLSGSSGKPDLRVHMLRTLALLERLRIGTNGRSTLLRRLSLKTANKAFQPVRTRFDWLTRDPAEVDKFANDPFCGWPGPPQLWIDLTYGILEIARPSNQQRIPPDLPLYIFAGAKDPVSDECKGLEVLMQAYRRAGLTDIQYKIYPGGRHEMLNEINREEVVSDLIAWLDDISNRKRMKIQSGVVHHTDASI
jgi:alpha-beta hydrolase superfamily lysophospholipase